MSAVTRLIRISNNTLGDYRKTSTRQSRLEQLSRKFPSPPAHIATLWAFWNTPLNGWCPTTYHRSTRTDSNLQIDKSYRDSYPEKPMDRPTEECTRLDENSKQTDQKMTRIEMNQAKLTGRVRTTEILAAMRMDL